jgi:hypothetical protein
MKSPLVRTTIPAYLNVIDSFPDRETLVKNLSPHKTLIWNFRNVLPDRCGTFEYRHPPQVLSGAETINWVVFTLSLIQHTMDVNAAQVTQWTGKPRMEDLEEPLASASQKLGCPLVSPLIPRTIEK